MELKESKENIETIKKIIDNLNSKENLTDNQFIELYLITKYMLNVILTEEN